MFFVALFGVTGFLAQFNETIELTEKVVDWLSKRRKTENKLDGRSVNIYAHRSPPYNAVKMIYTGSEVAMDFCAKIAYKDVAGSPQSILVTEFFPKEDSRMIWYHYKYDFLEPNQVVYFRLIKKKTTLDGIAVVVVNFTGAISGKKVEVRREFTLEDF